MEHPPPPTPSASLIAVGVDYSPASANAARVAIELARALGSRVHLLHAWAAPYAPADAPPEVGVPHGNHPHLLEMLRQSAQATMDQFVASLNADGVLISSSVESGDPRQVLVHFAETQSCRWVVVGKRNQSLIAEWFLGNVAAYVVRHCQVPVLVVPTESAQS